MPGYPAMYATMYPSTLVTLPTASYTAGGTQEFDSTYLMHAALDITLTSFTGGTAPSVTFALDRKGADGLWYPAWNSGATTTATVWSIDLCPSITQQTTGNQNSPTSATHVVWTYTGRFRWAFAGSPTSVQFSVSLIGR